MKPCLHRRSAFTLLELLVVLSIIALLATLTLSAVFRFQETQRETNTNKHLLKIQIGLDQQWKAAVDRISMERVPDLIYDLTMKPDGSRDVARAKALHMKLRLRQEFPQTYAEARFQFVPGPVINLQLAGQLNALYGPKPLYLAAIGAGTPNDDVKESAALLLIVLSQTRGGASFNAEEAGPIQTIDVGGKPMRVLVDAWDRPICLRRWATDNELNAMNNEINQPPFVRKIQNPMAMVESTDPQDPEGRLMLAAGATWGFPPNPAYRITALQWFTVPLTNPFADPLTSFGTIADPFDGRNRGPYVVSAGKNGKLITGDRYTNFMDPDDLYSFRLQREGKGN